MTKDENKLWQKIEAFELDVPHADFKFSQRLARENGWSHNYTQRVITEYKKFLFLCCINETCVTPSDPVDQAWHLHLTFTRLYWVDLCKNTIGKEIHHNPTKGGTREADKFDGFYTSTQKLYEDKFGMAPPADVWQNNKERFSDINFQRVNLRGNWVIKKPRISVALAVLVVVFIACTTFIQAAGDYGEPLLMVGIMVAVVIGVYKWESNPNKANRNKDNSGNGCSTAGCGGDSGSSHGGGHGGHDGGHSGCGSGCSGCSSSGCSGCGGGGD
jgi:hypothetical protein